MESKQQVAQDERERYEAPAVVELGTVAALTLFTACTYPSQCKW